MIVKCPSCGKLVPDKTGTCPKCGAALRFSAQDQVPEHVSETVSEPETEPVRESESEQEHVPEPELVKEPEQKPTHVTEPDPVTEPEYELKEDTKTLEDKKRNNNTFPRVVIISTLSTLLFASVIFVVVSFVRAGKSEARFEEKVEIIENLLEKGKYNDARNMVLRQKDEFKPSFMSGRISADVNALLNKIDSSLDVYVAETVEMVNMMRAANRGRIDDYCWELVRKALEEAPDDERLLQLRDRYIAQ